MSMANTAKRSLVEAPPLPQNIDDWVRHIKAERNFNDMVEDLHRTLVNEDPQYRDYLRAIYDIHAVTGSMSFDNCFASQKIQKKAETIGYSEVADEKLGIINLALGVVLRRYKASRKQRRLMLGGQVQANDTD